MPVSATTITTHAASASRALARGRRLGLLAWRWLLVLLLVLDQVGAPWHRHLHDAEGSPTPLWLATLASAGPLPELSGSTAALAHHGPVALRLQQRLQLQAEPSDLRHAPDGAPGPGFLAGPGPGIRLIDQGHGWNPVVAAFPAMGCRPPDGHAPPVSCLA